jgi:hypothetical protein
MEKTAFLAMKIYDFGQKNGKKSDYSKSNQ